MTSHPTHLPGGGAPRFGTIVDKQEGRAKSSDFALDPSLEQGSRPKLHTQEPHREGREKFCPNPCMNTNISSREVVALLQTHSVRGVWSECQIPGGFNRTNGIGFPRRNPHIGAQMLFMGCS